MQRTSLFPVLAAALAAGPACVIAHPATEPLEWTCGKPLHVPQQAMSRNFGIANTYAAYQARRTLYLVLRRACTGEAAEPVRVIALEPVEAGRRWLVQK